MQHIGTTEGQGKLFVMEGEKRLNVSAYLCTLGQPDRHGVRDTQIFVHVIAPFRTGNCQACSCLGVSVN